MTFIYKSLKLPNSQILFELNYKRCLVINEFVFYLLIQNSNS